MKTRDIRLSESAKLQRTGAVWEAVLITAGTGSSGEYTNELLEAAAQTKAFPAGTKLWFKHPEWRGQQRDKRDQWGVLKEDARYEDGKLVAPAKIFKHWADVVESLAEEGEADMSIYAAAAVNEDTGELLAIIPSPQNSVDIVDYPGRPGSGLAQKIERARESYRPTAESSAEEKETHMDKEIAEAIKLAVAESLKPIVDFVTNAKTAEEKAAQAQVDDQAIESAISERFDSYAVAEEAVKAAKLFPSQEAALIADARKGIDVTERIAEAKKVVDEARTVLTENAPPADEPGFIIGESAKSDSDGVSFYIGGSR